MSRELDEETRKIVRMLLYPTIFERELNQAFVDRVAGTIRLGGAYALSREELEAGMNAALASDADLSDWVAPQHPDAVVRDYLERLREALGRRSSHAPPD